MRGAVGIAALAISVATLSGCESEYPLGPPEVTASFITPELFHLAISGDDDSVAPALRERFHAEALEFATSSGCTSYRVMDETFVTSANINPRVSTSPSWAFGRRPTYVGLVECGLPDPHGTAAQSIDIPR